MVNISKNLGNLNIAASSRTTKTLQNKGEDLKLGKTEIEPYTITSYHKDGHIVTSEVGDTIDHPVIMIEIDDGLWIGS